MKAAQDTEKKNEPQPPVYYFCTYFDRHFLSRALALYQSLIRHCAAFHLFVLCLDHETFESLGNLDLPHTTAIRLDHLEQAIPQLPLRKMERSKMEYYYTCGPSFILYLLNCFSEIDLITYIDADVYFFADPSPLFTELKGSSVGIVDHRYPRRIEKLKRFGIYNVGWVSFRRDESGLECLRWWADRCIEWCYDRVEKNRFADQKYLEEFAVRFRAVHVLEHNGANLAPWNVASYQITREHSQILVDGQPLVFFHFHGFKVISSWLFDTNLGWYHASLSPIVRRNVFGPYIQELRRLSPKTSPAHGLRNSSRNQSRGFGFFARNARTAIQIVFAIVRRAYIVSFPRST
jgi:lipopolysaccharide biosynthesis glycosyltransferase